MCDQAGLTAMGDADRMGTSGRVQGTARCGVCLRKQGFAAGWRPPGGWVTSQLGPKASLTGDGGRSEADRQQARPLAGDGHWTVCGLENVHVFSAQE